MTTIIGIEAKKDNSVILASDLSATRTSWTPRGDIAYRRQTKEEAQKINVNQSRTVALASAGTVDKDYLDFLEGVVKGDINIEQAIKDGEFRELADMNLKRWEGRLPNDDISSFLTAVRFNRNPQLYTCWPLGKIEQRPFTAIGSGSEYALQHLTRYGEHIYRGMGLTDCLDITVAGLDEASRDIYTAGLDLVVVTPDQIYEFGSDIKSAIDSAKKRTISRIKKSFSKAKVKESNEQ